MSEAANFEGIAVVGMSGRFPRAADLEEFWKNLCEGVEGISSFSEEQLIQAGVSRAQLDHPQYVPAAGVIEGFEEYDAAFFDFNPAEAPLVDPHHRLFLEHSWQALENAGYDPRTYEGIIGVYGGMSTGEYAVGHLLADPEVAETLGGLELRIFNDKDFLASLAAYKLDLRGPSASVQTACSTSLVTTCLACQSLLNYQCDLALSGGVAVASTGRTGYFARAGVFSPAGRCRAFDAEADGTVPGYGVGVLVLKRLDRALEDGDTIHAVLRGWATNNDGSHKVGYTAPSVDGQAEVIAMAQAVAGVEAESITYVETHGTGTPLGDQIEMAALTEVFRETTDKKGFCAIGSVKTSIGHLDAAAGVASLLKTILALKHRKLPPSLHFRTPNPQIDFPSTPFFVQSALGDWPAGDTPRRAAVSSFAVGGVNAHLVLEEAPEAGASSAGRRWQLLPLSARTAAAVESATRRLGSYLRGPAPAPLADVAYTLQVGRRAFEHRRVVISTDAEEAAAGLLGDGGGPVLEGRVDGGEVRRAAFLFPGLGNHYVGMAEQLYREEPVFGRHLDRCAEALEGRLGLDFREVLYPDRAVDAESSGTALDLRRLVARGQEAEAGPAGELLQTALAQPVVFAVEYALARLWMSWGVEPDGMLGFSIGEYVAACLAGVFDLQAALDLVAARARMIEALPAGAMLAVALAEEEVLPVLGEELSISALNGPGATVVGGPVEAVVELEEVLADRGVVHRRLETSHAFHSKMLEPVTAAFRRRVGAVPLKPPEIPFVSNVTGTWITADQATDPNYWAEHLVRPVRFAEGVEALWEDPRRILLEVGPGQVLSSWALQLPAAEGEARVALASMRHAFDPKPDMAVLLTALGRLWLQGVEIDWSGLSEGERRRRVPLPTYPFERRRFWVDRHRHPGSGTGLPDRGELERIPDPRRWFFVPSWRREELRSPAPDRDREPRRWLLFVDAEDFGLALGERLEERGDEVVLVAAGDRFEKVQEGAYILDPSSPSGYAELFADLDGSGRGCDRIVHLFTLTRDAVTPDRALDLGVLSLLFLAQALGERPGDAVDLDVVSSHLHQVAGNEEVHPEKAAVLGPCAVLPLELPGVRCRSLDVGPLPAAGELDPRWIDRLLVELEAREAPAVAVAYRGIRRWVRRFEPLSVDPSEGPGRLRRHGVYLITGGLGGIGLTLAEELARTCEARLVLVGRTPLPAAEDWDAWLSEHPPGDPVTRKIQRLRRFEAMGAEVLTVSADVTDAEALGEVRQLVRERFGQIRGIVHAAGVPPGGLMQIKSREELLRVLAPKQSGVRALEQVFAGDDLDFVILCSSLTALVGAFGLVDHTSANALLDAYAQAAASTAGWPVTSVNWDAWLEVGQAAAVAAGLGFEAVLEGGERRPVGHPLLEECVGETDTHAVYRASISRASHWILDEHRVRDRALVPGTGYLEAVRAAWADRVGDEPCEMRQVAFLAPLFVEDAERRELRLTLVGRGEAFDFHVDSRRASHGDDGWVRHVEGRLSRPADQPAALDLDALRGACPERISLPGIRAESGVVHFGPRWQVFGGDLYLGPDQALAALELPPAFADDLEVYRLHPALLDVATGVAQTRSEGLHLPLGYEKITIWRPLPRRLLSFAAVHNGRRSDERTLVGDLTLLDEGGNTLVEISEYTLLCTDPAAVSRMSAQRSKTDDVRDVRGPEQRDGLRPSEGARAFLRLLGCPALPEQVLISTRDFSRIAEHLSRRASGPVEHALTHAGGRRGTHPRPKLATPFVAPRREDEAALAELWGRLLGIDEVGVDDNFFDLGGESLLATQLIARLKERFGVEISLRTIFEAPTVSGLASVIRELDRGGGTSPEDRIPVIPRKAASHPLSYAQQRLWFVSELIEDGAVYNIPTAVRLSGRLDDGALERAIGALVTRHEALRTRFEKLGEGPVQVIVPRLEVPLARIDLKGLPVDRREAVARESVQAVAEGPFDLTRLPLLRTALVRLEAGEHLLMVTIHHIVSDKWSQDIFIEELVALYRAFAAGHPSPLPALTLGYVDFTHWQRRWLEGERMTAQLEYWLERLRGAPAQLELPTDRPRPPVQSYPGDSRPIHVDADLAAGLERLSRSAGATLFMTLLAAFEVLLSERSGQDDVVVGTTISGRGSSQLEGLIGFFVNTLALRTDLKGDPSFQELLGRVREVALEAYANQDLPFEKLVRELRLERDPGRHPVFQVMFNLQEQVIEVPALDDGLEVTPLEPYTGRVKFDLTVFLSAAEHGITGTFVYNTDLFDEATIVGLIEDYRALLRCIVEQPEARLSSLFDAVGAERRQAQRSARRQLKVANLELLSQARRRIAFGEPEADAP